MLVDHEIRKLIEELGMIEDYTDLDVQVQTNGFDMCVDKLYTFKGKGRISFDNKDRMIGRVAEMPLPDSGKWTLGKGTYKVLLKETTNMPDRVCAIARPRSTLVRNGCGIKSGVWDAGYSGKSEITLIVGSDRGLEITPGARICQLIFFTGNIPTALYNGEFQGENLNE